VNAASCPFRPTAWLRYAVSRARAGVVCVAALALAGWSGSWHRIPELFAHFFLQYALVLVPLVALLWRDGRWRWAALATLILTGYTVAPFWLPVEDARHGTRLRLLQYNAAGQTDTLTHWLAGHPAEVDVVLVLEAGLAFEADMLTLANEFPYRIAWLDDSPFGIALISRHPLHAAHVLEVVGPAFPALQADIIMDGHTLRLIGIHPPPPIDNDLAQWRNRFMAALARQLEKERTPGQETLVFGDFNSTPWSPHLRDFMARRVYPTPNGDKARQAHGPPSPPATAGCLASRWT
jgi:endonuclease/exonuclease/phosphatase (EEP) superfamily protein YafD